MKKRSVVGVLVLAALLVAADGVITTQNGPLILAPANGRVGIGTNNPSAKLDVAGSMHVTGKASFDVNPLKCTTRSKTINSFTWSSGAGVQCESDEIMTGGGCYINNRAGGNWVGNIPDENGWYCLPAQNKAGSLTRAYARCCKLGD